MKLRLLVLAFAIVGILGGCEDRELRAHLTAWARDTLHPWQMRMYEAVCQVEEQVTGLDPAKRVCGGTGEGGRPSDPPVFD